MRLPPPSGPTPPSHVALLAILSDADGREVIRSFSDAIAPTLIRDAIAPTLIRDAIAPTVAMAEGADAQHGADAGMPDAAAAADEVVAYSPPTVAKGEGEGEGEGGGGGGGGGGGSGVGGVGGVGGGGGGGGGGLFPNWARAPRVWVGQEETTAARADVLPLELETALESPQLWSAESPYLYVGWPRMTTDCLPHQAESPYLYVGWPRMTTDCLLPERRMASDDL